MFGIDNTIAGMFYYGSIFLFEIAQLAFPLLINQSTLSIIPILKIAVSGIAAVVSIYLIFVQLVIIKEWCEYCLVSALISLAIFAVVLFSFLYNLLFSGTIF